MHNINDIIAGITKTIKDGGKWQQFLTANGFEIMGKYSYEEKGGKPMSEKYQALYQFEEGTDSLHVSWTADGNELHILAYSQASGKWEKVGKLKVIKI